MVSVPNMMAIVRQFPEARNLIPNIKETNCKRLKDEMVTIKRTKTAPDILYIQKSLQRL